jgi:hypothetical protein
MNNDSAPWYRRHLPQSNATQFLPFVVLGKGKDL